jgi:tRNA threonylcarbamoyladenosine biosynthesis protein TsaB
MNILALDSATAACSAAVWSGDGIAAHRFEPMARGHAEHLMPMVRDVMAESGLSFHDLDCIATTTGPGGFTGLRIGLAAARALAMAAKLPIAGYTTLEIVARSPQGQAAPHPRLVVLDAKRSDFYFQLFLPDGAALSEPATAKPAAIAAALASQGPMTICGDGANAVYEELKACGVQIQRSTGPDAPDAAVLAQIAHGDIDGDIDGDINFEFASRPPEPVYLRPPDAALPRR